MTDLPSDAASRRSDPLAVAKRRGVQVQARLRAAEGGALTGEQVADRLGITERALTERRRRGTLLAVPAERNRYAYPVWQFDARGPNGVLPGLAAVLRDLSRDGVHSPWTCLSWFLTGNVRLGGARPLDALRHGRLSDVRVAAAAYGEQGAA